MFLQKWHLCCGPILLYLTEFEVHGAGNNTVDWKIGPVYGRIVLMDVRKVVSSTCSNNLTEMTSQTGAPFKRLPTIITSYSAVSRPSYFLLIRPRAFRVYGSQLKSSRNKVSLKMLLQTFKFDKNTLRYSG